LDDSIKTKRSKFDFLLLLSLINYRALQSFNLYQIYDELIFLIFIYQFGSLLLFEMQIIHIDFFF
jgi:hypothetical protein